ncbi:MAG: hypothetical protein ACOYD9_05455 [Pyramidobacter sp.]
MKVQLTRPAPLQRDPAWELSRQLVTHPDSTYVINVVGRRSRWGMMIVDRQAVPRDGAMLLCSSERGFSLRRWHRGDGLDGLWGVVTWIVRRP